MGRTSEIRHRGARLVLTKPANMIPYTNTSDPSYVEVTAAGEPLAPPISTETVHQVLEAQFQVATEPENQVNQTESRLLIGLRLLMAQNPPMSERFANIRRWAIRPTEYVDSNSWLTPSLPSNAATPETINTALPASYVRGWAMRSTEYVDSDSWLTPSLPSNVATPETIITALPASYIRGWAMRPTEYVDSDSWLTPSLPINVATPEKIITALRLCGLIAIADRLSYLHRLVEDHQNEQSINLDSLRELALFFLSERQLVNPQIGVNPDGLVQVEWSIGERGTLAMVFLPSGFIRFAAISAPAQRGVESTRISGTLPKSETMGAIRPFTDRLAHS